MARSFTGISGDNLQSSSVIATSQPIWHSAWIKPNGNLTNGIYVVVTGVSGSTANALSVGYDSSNSGKASGRTVGSGGGVVQALSTTTITDAVWSNILGNNVSNTLRNVWLNGGSKGTSGSNQGVTGINQTRVSGRPDGAAGTAFKGLAAHISGGTGTLTDVEAQYIGGGGHPRAIQSCTYYCRLNQNHSPETADLGSISLTVNGTTFSNSDMPVVSTFFTGSSVANQSYTQGIAITSIGVAAKYEDVSSSYTVALYLVGASGGTTTATAGGTALSVIPITSATGVVAGDYCTIGAGSLTPILAVNGLNVLVGDPQTWSTSDTFTHFPCTSQTLTGLAVTTGTWGGTPTGTLATTSNYLFRAVNNTDATQIADSNLFSITISGGAGAGVSSSLIQRPGNPALSSPTNYLQFQGVEGISQAANIPAPVFGLFASTSVFYGRINSFPVFNLGFVRRAGPGSTEPFNNNQFLTLTDGGTTNPSGTVVSISGSFDGTSAFYGGSGAGSGGMAGILASSSVLYGALSGLQAGSIGGVVMDGTSAFYATLTATADAFGIMDGNSLVSMLGIGGTFQPLTPMTAVVDVRLGIGYQPWKVHPSGTSG